jgi:hypothetical protein
MGAPLSGGGGTKSRFERLQTSVGPRGTSTSSAASTVLEVALKSVEGLASVWECY